jgi:hypothetical protein
MLLETAIVKAYWRRSLCAEQTANDRLSVQIHLQHHFSTPGHHALVSPVLHSSLYIRSFSSIGTSDVLQHSTPHANVSQQPPPSI